MSLELANNTPRNAKGGEDGNEAGGRHLLGHGLAGAGFAPQAAGGLVPGMVGGVVEAHASALLSAGADEDADV